MTEFHLKGLGVAAVTPFNRNNAIDFDALGRLLDYLIDSGVDYIVVLGTTAETPTLSTQEKEKIKDFAVKHVQGKVPLVLGLGGNNTAAIVSELTTSSFEGYSAILSVVPYYNKPTQEGIYQHYKAIAEASPLPVILYNVPGRTGVNMLAETTLRIAREIPNIMGIKEASGNMEQILNIINNRPDGFQVVSGDDGLTYSMISQGADGVISVIANAFPAKFRQLVSSCMAFETEKAKVIHNEFAELFSLMFIDGNPAGIKCALNTLGYVENILRLPLVPASQNTMMAINKLTHQILD